MANIFWSFLYLCLSFCTGHFKNKVFIFLTNEDAVIVTLMINIDTEMFFFYKKHTFWLQSRLFLTFSQIRPKMFLKNKFYFCFYFITTYILGNNNISMIY